MILKRLLLLYPLFDPFAPINAAAEFIKLIAKVGSGVLAVVVPFGTIVVVGLSGLGVMWEDLPMLWSKDPNQRLTVGKLLRKHLRWAYFAVFCLTIGGCSLASGVGLIFAQAWGGETFGWIFGG